MPRKPGTKTITFTPEEIDQLGLTFEEDMGAAVKSRLKGNDGDFGFLPHDLRDFSEARAHGLGVSLKEVVINLLQTQMAASLNPQVKQDGVRQ